MGKRPRRGNCGASASGQGWGEEDSWKKEPLGVPLDVWLGQVRKQVDFYFSDANLRRDSTMKRKMAENCGYVDVATILDFNRIRALHCVRVEQLLQAIEQSDMLVLNFDRTKVRRDFARVPTEDVDTTSRQIVVHGLPPTFGEEKLKDLFSQHGVVRFVELPRNWETHEPRGFCFVEYASEAEAEDAIRALDGHWPPRWPANGRPLLRVLSKKHWLVQRQFKSKARCGTCGRSAASSSGTSASCLMRLSGFSPPQTVSSVREFVQQVVPVKYCDVEHGASEAVLLLRSNEDCKAFLEYLQHGDRKLGNVKPEAHILELEEETRYWQEAPASSSAVNCLVR